MMNNDRLHTKFASLTTAHVADACVRTGVEVRCAPSQTRSITESDRMSGRVLPAKHVGSVDIFLEVLEDAAEGDVLVVDNAGRFDEACVGDLVVLEVKNAGLSGMVIWGLHRDTADVTEIGLPVFSLGATPAGPQRLDPRPDDATTVACVGEWTVGREDIVLADDDGVLFVPAARIDDVLGVAETISDTERRQAVHMREGRSLRDQVRFADYLDRRHEDPSFTFRDHLKTVQGAIEV
jgi:regulator of RNase E activity RraA